MRPTPVASQSRPVDLRNRLMWGEPALTIIDVRDRDAFNTSRITGAISLTMEELLSRAQATLELNRDIYIYGDTDEMTASAAAMLREAGFTSVSELQGGLTAWQAARYEVEGVPSIA